MISEESSAGCPLCSGRACWAQGSVGGRLLHHPVSTRLNLFHGFQPRHLPSSPRESHESGQAPLSHAIPSCAKIQYKLPVLRPVWPSELLMLRSAETRRLWWPVDKAGGALSGYCSTPGAKFESACFRWLPLVVYTVRIGSTAACPSFGRKAGKCSLVFAH